MRQRHAAEVMPVIATAAGPVRALEAAFRNVTIGELISELIVAVVNKDLLQAVVEHKKP
jgi:hypothetical protein